jgi:hypothetical protein
MTDRPCVDASVNPEPSTHTERELSRLEAGGFVIAPQAGRAIRAVPAAEGFELDGPEPLGGCRLARGHGPGKRFVLLAGDGNTELGRSSALHSTTGAEGERHLVLGDGRLFRLLLRGPADARFELLGWEVPGAYLTARPGARGWTVTPEPASSGLREFGPLLVLLAAEILESEDEGRESGPEAET